MFSKSLVLVGWESSLERVHISMWKVLVTIGEKLIDSTVRNDLRTTNHIHVPQRTHNTQKHDVGNVTVAKTSLNAAAHGEYIYL